MSRSSDAKKARRRKRQAARGAAGRADPEFDAVAQAVAEVDGWLAGRGWLLDTENAGDDLVSWVYPPSAADVGHDCEPVTRIWITMEEDGDALVLEFGAALVGTGADDEDGVYLLDPDTLTDDIDALEAYRLGDQRCEL